MAQSHIAKETSVQKYSVSIVVQGDGYSEEEVGYGFIIIDHKPTGKPAGMIEDVLVYKPHRGKGYGKQIIEKLIEIAKAEGCYKVILDCADHNIPFYTPLGFVPWQNSMRLSLV